MASTSPKATRTATQTPIRGRGRGRPRLYARGSSSATARRKFQSSAQRAADNTPTGRRRPTYQNGYRPGGAGGGGRYVHPETGQEIPAYVYKEIVKSGEKGDTGGSVRRSAPLPPPLPPPLRSAALASIGPDGVYKPREERSYLEFHPGFDIEQPLLVLPATDVDGENYKLPVLPETKTVKILDIKEEEELRKENSVVSMRDASQVGSLIRESTYPEGSGQRRVISEGYMPGVIKRGPETAVSPVSPPPSSLLVTNHINTDPISMRIEDTDGQLVFPLPTDGVNGLAIDPALAALTPPPVPSIESTLAVPIDPALSLDPQLAQTQTPAATPTDGPLKDDTITLSRTSRTPPPMTPARPDAGVSPVKRGLSDVPTLASLRTHRTNAGKPPPRSLPPATTRKPRTQNQYPHEKLNLRAPSYRMIQSFKFSEIGWNGMVGNRGPRGLNNPQSSNQAEPISDKMIAVGYQQSSQFDCPGTLFRDQPDLGIDEELGSAEIDLVEYDMDEQDDKWLTNYNSHRMIAGDDSISREVFEFVMTKTEKEWVNLERKMPKVQAKPHGVGMPNRRRSSGRAGDDDDDEGAEDSKCAICDDGECENANAIVFCDGCNLAVHQECYGVPYIPEGQWHCRKCQQIPRQIASCVFCPNTDGAFKQTTTNRWAHLLCAIWIPEVRLANPSFMEPVEGVDLVPKSRWKLNCYICKQRMGACIQCSNRNCFLAFHVTCGRRARLHMKMKNTSGPGAQLESSGLKALCHKHVPADWRKENDVDAAAEDAMEFYANNFSGRDWGDSHVVAMSRSGILNDDDVLHGAISRGINHRPGDKRKLLSDQKTVWKLPSGAPVIPKLLYNVVTTSLARFEISNVQDFAAEACKYWTLKREARRGASLVRRLQVQADSNSFTSLEVIRKNYASMGRTQGGKKLERRKDFAGALQKDLIGLIEIVKAVRMREDGKVKEAEMMKAYVDAAYFPELPLMRDVLSQAQKLDRDNIFKLGFSLVQDRLENRLYPSVSNFAVDVRSVLKSLPTHPRLDFDIRISGYAPPIIAFPASSIKKDDIAINSARILDALKDTFENALASEQELRSQTQERPSKKARMFEQFSKTLLDTSANANGIPSSPNSPSAQLVKESSPEKPRSKVPPVDLENIPDGGTILGTVSAKLAKEMLVGSGDKGRPPWYVRDYRPCGMDVDSEPMNNGRDELPNNLHEKPSWNGVISIARRLTPPPLEHINGLTQLLQVADIDIPLNPNDEDQDMEDAPGEVDEDFLPPLPALVSRSEPEIFPRLHSDLHDEDAEGEVDDEPPDYRAPLPIPTFVNPPPDIVPLPDVDSAHEDVGNEDDLLGGYRAEDLPSPLGSIVGDSTGSLGLSTSMANVNTMLGVPQPTQLRLIGRDPMLELPDLPPNQTIPDKMDLENMTNTSVLSDYPDDVDEHGDFSMRDDGNKDGNAGQDEDENGENARHAEDAEGVEDDVLPRGADPYTNPPGKKKMRMSRKSMAFKRDSNGRFGRLAAASGREMRKKKR